MSPTSSGSMTREWCCVVLTAVICNTFSGRTCMESDFETTSPYQTLFQFRGKDGSLYRLCSSFKSREVLCSS